MGQILTLVHVWIWDRGKSIYTAGTSDGFADRGSKWVLIGHLLCTGLFILSGRCKCSKHYGRAESEDTVSLRTTSSHQTEEHTFILEL